MHISSHHLLAWLVIGLVAGWLAGLIVKGGGFGLIGDIIVGFVGAFIGGWLSDNFLHLHLGSGWVSTTVVAVIGAVLLLLVLRLVRRGV